MGADFERVVRLASHLAGATRGTSYGSPALRVNGKMFACVPSNKSAEPDSLTVRMSFTDRDLRLNAEPDKYYLTPHYEGYPCVLARLQRLSDDELRDLLEDAFKFESKKGRRKRSI